MLQNDEFDGWFFAYKNSGEPISLSLYNEPGQGYRLFANYQQVNDRGMSGVAKSVDELLDIINAVKIAQTGFVFLVDGNGTIIAHPNTELLGKAKLASISDSNTAGQLLNRQSFAMSTSDSSGLVSVPASQIPISAKAPAITKAQIIIWRLPAFSDA